MIYFTYKGCSIYWLYENHCYQVQDLRTSKTIFYSDEPLEKIKRRLDHILG